MLRLEVFIRRVPREDRIVLVSDHYFDDSEFASIDYVFSLLKRGVEVVTYPNASLQFKQIIWDL